MPHASSSTGVPPRLVTQSMMVSAPWSWVIFASVAASLCAPVEVSACTNASTFASGFDWKASRTLFGSTAAPHASSTTTGTPPVPALIKAAVQAGNQSLNGSLAALQAEMLNGQRALKHAADTLIQAGAPYTARLDQG